MTHHMLANTETIFDNNNFLTDGDYFIDLTKVKSVYCTLEDVTYWKKPSLKDYESNEHNLISNIRTFYINNYFVITDEVADFGSTHDITKYLARAGALKLSHHRFRELYSIRNEYRVIQEFKRGWFPKDLFWPIKQFINGAFFQDDYKIDDFYVESKIQFKKK